MGPENRIAGDAGFKNKTLFITGGTGFLGKVFLEKLLRTCPEVKKIYILVRTKKGKVCDARIKEVFENPVFNYLRKTHGCEIFKKVVPIQGDVSELNLGLSENDYNLLMKDVEIFYNMAASTRFDDPLKKAVLFNTRSAREALVLAKRCKKLMAFIHFSTAYCFPDKKIVYEEPYPTSLNPHEVLRNFETKKDDFLEQLGKKYMEGYPNTYTLTKALGESIICQDLNNFPIAIMRPSLVIPIWKEPIPGWTDNMFGPMGLMVAAGKGILRSVYLESKGYADFLPADVVVNAILLGTYDFLNNKTRKIYNLTCSSSIKVTWGEVVELGKKIVLTRMPFNWVVWYPGGSLKSSRFIHYLCVVFFHYIPAVFLDSLILLTGNKPVLCKIQRKLTFAFSLFEYYANNRWNFDNSAIIQVRDGLNETERKLYKLDTEGVDLEDYFYNCMHSTRLYLLNETDESLPMAWIHMNIMWTVDKICKALLFVGLVYFLIQIYLKMI